MSLLTPIAEAAGQLEVCENDLRSSTTSTFAANLARLMAYLSEGTPLGEAMRGVLPQVDFDTWYQQAMATGGSMVGSGRLNWPVETGERVAVQYGILQAVTRGRNDVLHFGLVFFGKTNFHDLYQHFVDHIIRPFRRDLMYLLRAILAEEKTKLSGSAPSNTKASALTQGNAIPFIDQERLNALRNIHQNTSTFDLSRLIRLCEELDSASRTDSFMAIAALTRAVLDHVPPIFGARSFREVIGSYGSRSFKETMEYLDNTARKIADTYLHTPIRSREALPNRTQVHFSPSLDVLLGEVIRVLRAE